MKSGFVCFQTHGAFSYLGTCCDGFFFGNRLGWEGRQTGGVAMTVWAEHVFVLNALLDYTLLAGAVRLRGRRPGKRLIPASLIGGGLAVCALFTAANSIPISIPGFFVIAVCAYGLSLDGMRLAAIFLALSLTLCGIQTALVQMAGSGLLIRRNGVLLMVSSRGLLASAALLYGMCAAMSGAVRSRQRKLIRVQVFAAGQMLCFQTLADTGSFLRDPLTGRPVILADGSIAKALLGVDREELKEPALLLERLLRERPELRPRLIPYKAIGTEHGMLLGIRCSEMKVGKERRNGGILAFSPENVSEDGSYHGLTGG